VFTFGTLSFALPASANQPVTANAFQLGLGFRYGVELGEDDFNPFGTGLGVDVGYTLPNALYLGGTFDYFFGQTEESEFLDRTGNVWQVMAEGGYDLGFGEGPYFVVRPKVGLGVASYNEERCVTPGGCEDSSESAFALAPGATFLFATKSFSLSLDLRYDVIFADDDPPDALIFSVGVGF
jgi:hypothetical protein